MTEYEYTTSFPNARVQVSKVGGGTVGRTYAGSWEYVVTLLGETEPMATGADLTTGMPKSHQEAADIVADYFPVVWDAPFDESGEYVGTDS